MELPLLMELLLELDMARRCKRPEELLLDMELPLLMELLLELDMARRCR